MLKSLIQNALRMTLMLLISASIITILKAQSEISISIVVPAYEEDFYKTEIEQFELENPGIEVIIRVVDSGPPYFYGGDIEVYLDSVANYSQLGDVVVVNSQLLPEATRAGYFLDLRPLVDADGSLNPEDFYPTLWDSFQWDAGFWAIPVAGDVIGLFYSPQAFDELGLSYPNANWSVHDLSNAIQQLTVINSEGKVLRQGLSNAGTNISFGMLLVSSLGDDVVDDTVLPNLPDFSNPELEPLLEVWEELFNTGAVGGIPFGSLPSDLPLSLGTSFLGVSPRGTNPLLPSPFPGGRIGIDPYGLAISAGSLNPLAAYKLITFLTNSPELLSRFYSQIPARRSMLTVAGRSYNQMSEELQTFIAQGMEEGISLADARFSNYLAELFFASHFAGDEVNVQSALAEIQITWSERLRIADNRGQGNKLAVLPPPTATLLPSDRQINLVFGISQTFLESSNRQEWLDFLNDFAANEAGIAAVQVETNLSDNNMTNVDCYYSLNNDTQSLNTMSLVNLDPLMSIDPNLDMNDFLPGLISQVQQNGLIWGFPINIQLPLVMKYHAGIFEEGGIGFPENGWTISEFELALRSLKTYLGENEYPFSPNRFSNNNYLLALIAAYGGVPVDARTSPITYNFTDPANVEAIRQVLDLVVENYIAYSPFTTSRMSQSFTGDEAPIYSESLDWASFASADAGSETPYRLTAFPSGSEYSAFSFYLGAAYINGNARDIEACYRLISHMANHPHLFYAMPARYSLIASQDLVTTQGQTTMDFYNRMAEMMGRPNTIILPGINSLSRLFESYWLDRVFDHYVAGEIGDLAAALAEAEQYTVAFQECSTTIPPYRSGIDDSDTYYDQYFDCAVRIDPTSAAFFQR